ncbi:MAG: hypothetical protein ACOC3V_00325 [bacterium]
MRSRYDLANTASQKSNVTKTYYKDIYSIPTRKFQYNETSESHTLNQGDLYRQDIMIHSYYDVAELDDIVLWLNNIGYLQNEEVGKKITIPALSDMENFYYKYRK